MPELPGSPVVKTALPLQGAPVPSLVREQQCCMPHSTVIKHTHTHTHTHTQNTPIYRDDPQKMKSVFSISATHNPIWADVESLLNTTHTSAEHRMVLNKAREEADGLHTETPGNSVCAAASIATPTVDPICGLNSEHYQDCLLAGPRVKTKKP